MDVSQGMQRDFEYYLVDPVTWRDAERVDYVTGEGAFTFADNAGYIDDAIRRKNGRENLIVKLNSLYNKTDPVRKNGTGFFKSFLFCHRC